MSLPSGSLEPSLVLSSSIEADLPHRTFSDTTSPPPSTTSPPRRRTSLSDLPSELIDLILEHSIDSRYHATADVRYTANRTLRYASRVCRAWRTPAQELLWKDVELLTMRRAKLFCRSVLNPMPITRALTVGGDGDQNHDDGERWDEGIAEAVLNVCRGMYEVRLRFLSLFSASGLCVPSMSDVTSLVLSRVRVWPSSITIGDCPCRLTHLELDPSTTLPSSLLSALLQPTLTSLSLVLYREPDTSSLTCDAFTRNDLAPVLSTVFPHLTTFSASIHPDLEPIVHPLYVLLTRLKHVECYQSDLPLLPTALRTWTTQVSTWIEDETLERVTEALRSMPALRQLERLVLNISGEDEGDFETGWRIQHGVEALEEECRARNITLDLRSQSFGC